MTTVYTFKNSQDCSTKNWNNVKMKQSSSADMRKHVGTSTWTVAATHFEGTVAILEFVQFFFVISNKFRTNFGFLLPCLLILLAIYTYML